MLIMESFHMRGWARVRMVQYRIENVYTAFGIGNKIYH